VRVRCDRGAANVVREAEERTWVHLVVTAVL